MALSSCIELSPDERTRLLTIARNTIHIALQGSHDPGNDRTHLTAALLTKRGVFVTLTQGGSLRGCVGTIEPNGPLARAVADSAHSAAFKDPRFPPLQMEELATTSIEVSVLSPLESITATSREALLAQLQPGVDGLLLQDGRHRSTFLPKVWEQLPEPREFLDQLLAKAGLPTGHWSPSVRVHRYQTITFIDSDLAGQSRPSA